MNRIIEPSDAPLTEERPPEKRLQGCCRDFSTFLASILRYKGIAARARCGFATYFGPGHYEDHWVCQYWEAGETRWVRADAQLDTLQCDADRIPGGVPLRREHLYFRETVNSWIKQRQVIPEEPTNSLQEDPLLRQYHTFHRNV